MANQDPRMRILEMIENDQLTAEQGIRLLQDLPVEGQPEAMTPEAVTPETLKLGAETPAIPGPDGAREGTPAAVERPQGLPGQASPTLPVFTRWQSWWLLPLGIGVAFTVFGALLMYWILLTSGANFWFFFSILPLLFGVLVMVFSWQNRDAPWLHLRVSDGTGTGARRFALSFPLPVRLGAWFLRLAGPHVNGLQGAGLETLLANLDGAISPQQPIYIDYDDAEDGDHVEIYIG